MKTMHGRLRRAPGRRGRARGPRRRPTNISTNSEPESEKNGTPASPGRRAREQRLAGARRARRAARPSGCGRRAAGTSPASSGTRRSPAAPPPPRRCRPTSLNVTPVSGSMWTRARVLPNAITPGGPWPICPRHAPHHPAPEQQPERDGRDPDPEQIAHPAARDRVVRRRRPSRCACTSSSSPPGMRVATYGSAWLPPLSPLSVGRRRPRPASGCRAPSPAR